MIASRGESLSPVRRERGSVLIIVLVICLGLATLLLYYSSSISAEVQASADQVANREAIEAVDAGTRYATYILNNYAIDGVVPASGLPPQQTTDYYSAALPVANDDHAPKFWFVGRDPNNLPTTTPVFSLVDECSKLSLNSVSAVMLERLPMQNITQDLAQAIVSWRSKASTANGTGAANTYPTLDPPRLNKGASYESTDELRLVYGATLDLCLGEDTNRNGTLDANEDDGDALPPHDNQDGQLQPGLFEYVTGFSNQPTKTRAGANRVNVSTLTYTSPASAQALTAVLTRKGMSRSRATAIEAALGAYVTRAGAVRSLAEFYVASRMTATEFQQVHTSITTSQSAYLVNVNTASAAVLTCIPGIGADTANTLVAYRNSNPTALTSLAWVTSILSRGSVRTWGPWLTDQSYQFSADIAAVGRNGRGYHREKIVFDTSGTTPRVIYRQDLSSFGWALGDQTRQDLLAANP